MRVNLKQIVAIALMVASLSGCAAPSVQTPSTSALPTASQPSPAAANRVVALTSLSADILQRLDKTKLVGMPGSRLLNSNPAFSQVTKVSEGRVQPNLEKIVALKPDLVVGAKGFHDQTMTKLEGMGIRTLLVDVNSWSALEDLTKTLATAIQADPTALLASYKTFIDPTDQPSSTLVLVSRQPLLAPNKTSWTGDLLTQFQAKNLVADLQGSSSFSGYVTLSPEKVLQSNPDILLVVDTGQGEVEKMKTEPFWNKLKATQGDRVYVFDYYGLVNPGSIDAIQAACKKLKQALDRPT
ncbi:ABC transporter substrate-binding protein [Leptolyngbyaceae cyanobacterium UHCC 1019]